MCLVILWLYDSIGCGDIIRANLFLLCIFKLLDPMARSASFHFNSYSLFFLSLEIRFSQRNKFALTSVKMKNWYLRHGFLEDSVSCVTLCSSHFTIH